MNAFPSEDKLTLKILAGVASGEQVMTGFISSLFL